MISTNPIRRAARPIRQETPAHVFAVRQAVRLRGGFGKLPQHADIYHITGMLPPKGVSPQYRIRNDDERHERVTTQDSLEPLDKSLPGGATLIERTFNHG